MLLLFRLLLFYVSGAQLRANITQHDPGWPRTSACVTFSARRSAQFHLTISERDHTSHVALS